MKEVWPDSFVEEGSLSRNIHELRKALGDVSSEPRYIETIPKRGYRFIAPVTVLVVGILLTCPASYAKALNLPNLAATQSSTPPVTEQSDPTPRVRIRLQIQGVGQNIEAFACDQQTEYRTVASDDGTVTAPNVSPGVIVISKRIDAFSPVLNQIHLNGQHMREVVVQWFSVDPSSRTDHLFFTMKLGDVSISSIRWSLVNQQDPANARLSEVEAISFKYKAIRMIAGAPDVSDTN